jgi:hypothetical protein
MAIKNYIHEGAVLAAAAGAQGEAVGALTKRVITAAALVNTTDAPVAASVYLVPSGGSAAAANALISARTINPGETYFCPELVNQGLNQGGQVFASGLGLTFRFAAKDITNG